MRNKRVIKLEIERGVRWSIGYAKEALRRNDRSNTKMFDLSLRNMNCTWLKQEIEFVIMNLKDFR